MTKWSAFTSLENPDDISAYEWEWLKRQKKENSDNVQDNVAKQNKPWFSTEHNIKEGSLVGTLKLGELSEMALSELLKENKDD